MSTTRNFSERLENTLRGRRETEVTTLAKWFDGPSRIRLDEEIVGLGSYEHTSSIFSSDKLSDESGEDDEEEELLIGSYTPRFAYGR